MLVVKLKVNGVIEETANCGNVDTSTVLETIDMQPEELREGKLTGIKRKVAVRKG